MTQHSDVPNKLASNPRFRLGPRDSWRIVWPYLKRNFTKQLEGIWFIVTYLIFFQWFVLKLPIVFALMISLGILVVAVGLMFFMEGLRLGLMPLGEAIGSILPRHSKMPMILLFAFLLGIGATLAEPAIAVLRAAGSSVQASQQPLLYSLLNDFAVQLVSSVGIGVGVAVMLGVLRFFYGWPLKYLAIPAVSMLIGISVYFSQVPMLNDVLGVAWDCGAVTTGPVTVPLVLALGIGVCRVVTPDSNAGHSGFGIVTLASLFPILAVLMLAYYHYLVGDYFGGPNYQSAQTTYGQSIDEVEKVPSEEKPEPVITAKSVRYDPILASEFEQYLRDGRLPENYEIDLSNSEATLVDGEIVISDPKLMLRKLYVREFSLFSEKTWDTTQSIAKGLMESIIGALRAIVPLCLFFYFVLRFVLKQSLEHAGDVLVGVCFAFIGMSLFSLGIALGLTPLGTQLGSNIPLSFAQVVPWGLGHVEGPLYGTGHGGKFVAVGFAFLLGYGATLAEPALNALGDTVEKITVGAFPRRLLMQSVAIGVGLGIGAGVVKMAYNLPLLYMLVPPYTLVLFLTMKAPNEFVNFAWDSAGVTTGPITVPLVLAMGLGIGATIPGVNDGFGILALASVGPILTVLSVGLYTQHRDRKLAAANQSNVEVALDINTETKGLS